MTVLSKNYPETLTEPKGEWEKVPEDPEEAEPLSRAEPPLTPATSSMKNVSLQAITTVLHANKEILSNLRDSRNGKMVK